MPSHVFSLTGDHLKWFQRHRKVPVTVTITGNRVEVAGAPQPYRLHQIKQEQRFWVLKEIEGQIWELGIIDRHTIRRPLSETAVKDLSVIRMAMFGASYPTTLAYEMMNGDLVHPGKCFEDHESVLVRRKLFTMRDGDDERRCSVCKETFE